MPVSESASIIWAVAALATCGVILGSLATLLWLVAIRREGEHVSAWRFLCLGMRVMPPALAAALLALWV